MIARTARPSPKSAQKSCVRPSSDTHSSGPSAVLSRRRLRQPPARLLRSVAGRQPLSFGRRAPAPVDGHVGGAMPIPASLPRPEHPATPALSGSRGRPAAPSSGRRTTPPATRPPAPAVPCGGAGAQARSSRDRRLQPPSNSASTQVCRRRRPRTSPAPKRADPAGTRARPATAAAASSPPAAPPPPAPKGGGHQLRTGRLVMNARRQDRLLRPSLEEAAADGIGGGCQLHEIGAAARGGLLGRACRVPAQPS